MNLCYNFTAEEGARYARWREENGLNGYHGAIGGQVTFEITPTSLGTIIVASSVVPVKDELGEVSCDANGNPKAKRIECVIRDI